MKENRIDRLLNYPGRMEASEYLYTSGILAEEFFKSLKEDCIIKAAYCRNCEKLFLPPRAFCLECGKEVKELKEINQEGKIESFTYAKIDSYGEELKEPFVLAYIKFEGVEGGLVHKVISKDKIKIGQKVKPVFKENRIGSLEDIAYFETFQ